MKARLSFIAALSLFGTSASAATTYTYDDLGRISTSCYDNSEEIVYSYDPAGNRTQVAVVGCIPNQ